MLASRNPQSVASFFLSLLKLGSCPSGGSEKALATMPFLGASALETNPEGAAFLLAVLRWRHNPRQGRVEGQLRPVLGPYSICSNGGLTANRRVRKSVARESDGHSLSRQSPFHLAQPPSYRVTVKTGTHT